MKKYFILTLVIIIISPAIVSAYSEYGIAGYYNKATITEKNTNDSNSQYYFINNDESKRQALGINLFISKNFNVNDFLLFNLGPFVEYAKLKIDDKQPTGINNTGLNTYAFGINTKLILNEYSFVKPYFKFAVASEWSEVEIKTNAYSPYMATERTYKEKTFGPVLHFGIGILKNYKKVGCFVELDYLKGWHSPEVSGDNNSAIPVGNNYKSTSYRVMFGIIFQFGKNNIYKN